MCAIPRICQSYVKFDRGIIMYKEHPVFEKPDDENIKIWRYLDFTKLASQLDKQTLFFIRADKLSDPFEGSYSKANIKLRPIIYKDIPKKSQEHFPYLYKEIKRFTFVNCWHINEGESAAMWKLYLKSDEGVAIQSTFKRLTESFNDYLEDEVYVGKVRYIDYETEWLPEGNVLHPFLHKRKSFEHEHELRAIIQKLPIGDKGIDLTRESFDLGMYIPVNLDILIEKIFVSPTAPKWFTDLITSIVDKYNLKKEVIQSSLANDPVY